VKQEGRETLLLIPAVTPFFLEKGEDWFLQNFNRIVRARGRQRWWRAHTFLVEKGAALSPLRISETLEDLGYGRVDAVRLPGEMSRKGGYISVWSIGSKNIWQIEFLGNRVEELRPLAAVKLVEPGKRRKGAGRSLLGELSRLMPGDYVVHQDHGIGIFRGIEEKDGEEVFVLEYAPPRTGGLPDRLFVPTSQSKKISVYFGFVTPVIHRLGSDVWAHTKRRAREDTIKMAKELLALYASRHVSRRPPYKIDRQLEKALEAGFPYVETEDQLRVMSEIENDLSKHEPMDRLLIGDVGFGKTEVALRAALKAVVNGKQVALLAPTTILADQHFHTFAERLEPLGVRVGELSRIVPQKEEKMVLHGLRSGEIDVVIGTHRILSQDVHFKNLGFLIIDEEQRFGVRQKEKLKTLRSTLDVLSLSATPIPRTMYMALAQLRPVSILSTPPAGRLPIKTFVMPYSDRLIAEAIASELKRDGQVYFLHNRVETIAERARALALAKVAPVSKIAFIHGRMPERELMATMEKFRRGDIKVLVATTIIENGLDLSNVNTLIVADALRLGLGQAYQLRGRIGRGPVRAYAYFLYSRRNAGSIALERLVALKEAEELGSGYYIAKKDLELRGAGNILGKEQSGTVNAIGLNLYMQMLAEAVERLK